MVIINGIYDCEFLKHKLEEAHTVAVDAGCNSEAVGISYLSSLIEDMEALLSERRFLRKGLANYLDWLIENLPACQFFQFPGALASEPDYVSRPEIQKSLEKAIRRLHEILLRFGRGPLIDAIRKIILIESARFVLRRMRRNLRMLCGSLRKLGLCCHEFGQHYFISYLVPKPRGELIYADAKIKY